MQGYNKVIIGGNLGNDPELRYTNGGQAVLTLSLAVNESWVDRDGVKHERVDWLTVVVWGKRGEALAKHLKKGDGCLVEGKIRIESYEKDGVKKYATKIVCDDFRFTGGGAGGQGGGGGGRESSGGGGYGGGSGGGGGQVQNPRSRQAAGQGQLPAGGSADRGGPPAGGYQGSEPPHDYDAGGEYGGNDDIPF